MADTAEQIRTIRFPFNPITCLYSKRHKFSELGWPISDNTQEEFFKAIYEGVHNFKVFKHYKMISRWAIMVFLILLAIGVIILVLGFLPISGDSISSPTLAAGGSIALVSIIAYTIWSCSMSSFYKNPLYRDYGAIIHSVVFQFFNQYLTSGLSWTPGRDGFRCLEFSVKVSVAIDDSAAAMKSKRDPEDNRI